MKREVIIPFRVSAREKEELEKKAAACGWSLSDYIRACISATHVTVIEGADALTDELRRIGNNLNQLTRYANGRTTSSTFASTPCATPARRSWSRRACK